MLVPAIFLLCAAVTAQQPVQLSLAEAITLALRNNDQVITAQREVDAASARILQAGRIPNPEIEVSWGEAPSFFKIGEADEIDISFRQEIEFPARRSARIDVAEQDRRIAELRLDRIRTIQTAAVRKAYYGILITQSTIRSLDEQSILVQDFFDLTGNKLSTGAGSYLDVIRTKVELTRLGNEILEAMRDEKDKSRTFNILLGQEPDTPFTLTDTLVRQPTPVNRDSVSNELPRRSSLLEASRTSVERQKRQLDLARSGYLPDFTLSLSGQRRSEEPPFDANGFNGTTTRGVGLSLAVSVPLWFWQEPAGRIHEAAAHSSIAGVEYAATARRVRSSVGTALGMVEAAENQVNAFNRTLLADLGDIMSTAVDHYRNNRIDVMNLLDVYRTYRTALVEYNRALLNYWNSRANLDASAELPLSTVND